MQKMSPTTFSKDLNTGKTNATALQALYPRVYNHANNGAHPCLNHSHP
jgi:hypothetical protein